MNKQSISDNQSRAFQLVNANKYLFYIFIPLTCIKSESLHSFKYISNSFCDDQTSVGWQRLIWNRIAVILDSILL